MPSAASVYSNLFVLLGITFLKGYSAESNDTDNNYGWASFEEAKQLCQQNSTYLFAPHSESDLQRLSDDLDPVTREVTWLDAKVVLQHWHWTTDNSELYNQGCYEDTDLQGLVEYDFVTVNTVHDCTKSCKSSHYKFAGVKFFAPQHWQCYCATSLPEPSLAVQETLCESECPGRDTPRMCGTQAYTRMMATGPDKDDVIEWHHDTAPDGSSLCGALTVDRNWYYSTHSTLLVRDHCANKHTMLCIVSTRCSSQGNCISEPGYEYHTTYTSQRPLSWIRAHALCQSLARSLGGTVSRVTKQDTEYLKVLLVHGPYWLPLRAWHWQGSATLPMESWSSDQPAIEADMCVQATYTGKLHAANCSFQQPYICQNDTPIEPSGFEAIPVTGADISFLSETLVSRPIPTVLSNHTGRTQAASTVSPRSRPVSASTSMWSTAGSQTTTAMVQALESTGSKNTRRKAAIAAGVIGGNFLLIVICTFAIVGLRPKKTHKTKPVSNPVYRMDSDVIKPISKATPTKSAASRVSIGSTNESPSTSCTYESLDAAVLGGKADVHYDVPPSSPYSVPFDTHHNGQSSEEPTYSVISDCTPRAANVFDMPGVRKSYVNVGLSRPSLDSIDWEADRKLELPHYASMDKMAKTNSVFILEGMEDGDDLNASDA